MAANGYGQFRIGHALCPKTIPQLFEGFPMVLAILNSHQLVTEFQSPFGGAVGGDMAENEMFSRGVVEINAQSHIGMGVSDAIFRTKLKRAIEQFLICNLLDVVCYNVYICFGHVYLLSFPVGMAQPLPRKCKRRGRKASGYCEDARHSPPEMKLWCKTIVQLICREYLKVK
jgi:hypothetical protein